MLELQCSSLRSRAHLFRQSEGMFTLIATLSGLILSGQEPVHRANRAVITAFIEQRGVDRGRRYISEALAVEHAEQQILLGARECQGRSRPCTRQAPWANCATSSTIAGTRTHD